MPLLFWIIVFSLIGSALSVLAAGVFLLIPEQRREHLLPHGVSFAIGAMLGAAFLGLLPHALENETISDAHHITMTVLFGILGFFLLEKMVLWRHCHHDHCQIHGLEHSHNHKHKTAGYLILVGDGFHNFVDGVLIAAAFLTDMHLGIVTALAVAAHEVPQELGDFAVLLHSGFSRLRALLLNLLSSLATVLGAVLAYFSLSGMEHVVPFIIAIAAASFIYIAVADLIPGLHQRTQFKETMQQIIMIGAGVSLVFIAHANLH
ncbi:MAG: ZIP family metal transporter [Thiohalomonadaceae bacterium]